MKKLILFLLFITSFCTLSAQSQQAAIEELDASLSFLNKTEKIGYRITDVVHSPITGVQHIYYILTYDGKDIINTPSNAFYSDTNQTLSHKSEHKEVLNYHIQEKRHKASSTQKATQVIGQKSPSLKNINLKIAKKDTENIAYFEDVPNEAYHIKTQKVYYLEDDKTLIPAWKVEYENHESKWLYVYISDRQDKIIRQGTYSITCQGHSTDREIQIDKKSTEQKKSSGSAQVSNSYLAIPFIYENPNESDQMTLIEPWSAAPNASPFGWHDIDGVAGADFTNSRGNNVDAFYTINDVTETYAEGGSELMFNYNWDLSQQPENYVEASVTNMFYIVNICHDIFFQYGFDEQSGNFQQKNYSGEGRENDHIFAEAQNSRGTNNATFSAPPDGTNGQLDMFLWNPSFSISANTDSVQDYSIITSASAFADNATEEITAPIAFPEPSNLCIAQTGGDDLMGKIAIVDRGDCLFVEKVRFAQNQGAVAVLFVNYDNTLSPISGNENDITIPAFLIRASDGDWLSQNKDNNLTITIGTNVMKDSALDNGVLTHEFVHGVTIRLTGGPSNSACLGNDEQMGEGWSDFFAALFTIKEGENGADARGIGTYLIGEDSLGQGIRPYPLSTDMNINPSTYENITEVSIPHGVGNIWSGVLWDIAWEFIDIYGFDTDWYNGTGGNNKVLKLIMESLRYQVCGPGFVTARDAILEADRQLYEGQHTCQLWSVFARRGIGIHADQGSEFTVGDETVSYDLPDICTNDLTISQNILFDPNDNTKATIIYQIFSSLENAVLDYEIKSTYYAEAELIEASITGAQLVSRNDNKLTLEIPELLPYRYNEFSYQIDLYPTLDSILYYNTVDAHNLDFNNMTEVGSDAWNPNGTNPADNTAAFHINNSQNEELHYLVSDTIRKLPPNTILTFDHRYVTETQWDGGNVQIASSGNNFSFENTDTDTIINGYDTSLGDSSNRLIRGLPAYTGDEPDIRTSQFNLSDYEGQDIVIRFLFGSDNNTDGDLDNDADLPDDGWLIDNILIAVKQESEICAIGFNEVISQGSCSSAVLSCSEIDLSTGKPQCVPYCTDINTSTIQTSTLPTHYIFSKNPLTLVGDVTDDLFLQSEIEVNLNPFVTVEDGKTLELRIGGCDENQN